MNQLSDRKVIIIGVFILVGLAYIEIGRAHV